MLHFPSKRVEGSPPDIEASGSPRICHPCLHAMGKRGRTIPPTARFDSLSRFATTESLLPTLISKPALIGRNVLVLPVSTTPSGLSPGRIVAVAHAAVKLWNSASRSPGPWRSRGIYGWYPSLPSLVGCAASGASPLTCGSVSAVCCSPDRGLIPADLEKPVLPVDARKDHG